MWTAARVSGHGMRANAACPHCGAAHEDEAHVLWDCPKWGDARGTWLPWLNDAAGATPSLGPPDRWPSCPRKAGLFPLRLAQGVDRDLLDEFLYRLYGMYLAVLAARMAASAGDQPGHGDSLFPEQPRPRPRDPYPWDAFFWPHTGGRRPPPAAPTAGVASGLEVAPGLHPRHGQMGPGASPGSGAGGVSWAELALDYEAFVGRALLASPDHRLRGTHLPLGNEPRSCARRWGRRSATWRRSHCWAGPHSGVVARSSPSGGACARGSRLDRTSRRGTRSCCS